MRKTVFKALLLLMLLGVMFVISSCEKEAQIATNADPQVVSYYLNDDGSLISVFNDGTETNLGKWAETVIQSLKEISLSNDGFYVIDGVKTEIAVDYSTVVLSSDGYYIINGVKTNISVDFSTVGLSNDGYYVIDGVKTEIAVDYSSVALSSDGYYIINGVKTSISVDYSTVEISEDGYYIIDGIKTNIVATAIYTVSFEPGFNTNLDDQLIKDGYTVSKPELQRTGYSLDGWFCNGEEWRFNSDIVKHDLVLTAKWTANEYTVSFENGKGANPGDMVVTFGSKASLPQPAEVEGYDFEGWFNGDTVVNDAVWSIDSDVVLTAKWTAKKYTVTLNANGGNVSSSSVVVEYGKGFELPVPTNDYGLFTGWKYDGQYVTDSAGHSIANWSYLEAKEFSCDWIIHIKTAQDLIDLSEDEVVLNLTKNRIAIVEIDNDIDLAGFDWTPITLNGVELRGNNHTISNLTSTKGGLFDDVGITTPTSTIIKDLKLSNIDINVTASTNVVPSTEGFVYVGALARRVRGSIENVEVVSGQITINQTELYDVIVGGIAVFVGGTIRDCINRANVTSNMLFAYGISMNGNPHNCKNYGNISSGTDYISPYLIMPYYIDGYGTAGICGEGTVLNCHNYGTIHAINTHACGIAVNADATQCSNHGNVISEKNNAAGITIGQSVQSGVGMNVLNCYNVGNIQGDIFAAGIDCGALNTYYCYNLGAISGKEKSGGIATNGSVVRCVNVDDNFTAYKESANIVQCYVYDGTSALFKDTLSWSEDIWDFSTEGLPELKD